MSEVHPTFTCFDDAGEFCMRNGGTVVHGLIPNAHAWVELDGKVWQAGMIAGRRSFYAMPRDAFYADFKPVSTSRYAAQLFLTLWRQHNNPGPWRAEYLEGCSDDQTIHAVVNTKAVVEIRTYNED
jgi:hypothetical protein